MEGRPAWRLSRAASAASTAMDRMIDTPFDAVAARAAILERMAAAAKASVRPGAVLVAVSKQQPEARIEAMLAAGQRVFGENRVQEARARWGERRARFADLKLHLIGPLQSNKAEDAVALFNVIESLDRAKLAAALAEAAQKLGRSPALFVQVNTGEEPQKAGVLPANADAFIKSARSTESFASSPSVGSSACNSLIACAT